MKNRIYSAKTVCCTVFCGILIATTTWAQAPTPGQASAQEESREGLPASYTGPVSAVAAVVDDQVITTFDVYQRMKLMMMSSEQQISPQMMQQLQGQALRDLVEEKLKLIEAKKYELEVSDSEVQQQLQQLAAGSGLTTDQLVQVLRQDGIAVESMKDQIKASIAWPQIVSGRFRSRIKVSDDEVEQTLERMREDASNEQYLVSEICIPVPDSSQAQQYYQGSMQLIEQMRRGVPFAIVAQQFSACSTAAAGGDLGWIRSGELPSELDEAVKALPPGSVSNPIPSDGAFMIVAVRDKRAAAVQGEESFTLVYGSAPLSIGRNDAMLGLEKLNNADLCSQSGTRIDLGANIDVAVIENVKASSIDERFRNAVANLERGELSPPVEADGALHAVYACEKDEGLGLPSRAAIEDRIFQRQLSRIAQQYLRDLERGVHVDVRMRPQQQAPQPNG
ncbi:MAG: peptidylprolyl isomerase [Amphiplicatus sp.]